MLTERQIEILILMISFLLFSISISNGLNVFDFVNYAYLLKQSFATGNYSLPFQAFGAYGGGQGGLSRNFLFILLSYPFTYIFSNLLKADLELTLNIFSAIMTSLSITFVYKIARLFLDKKKSLYSAMIYLSLPIIFFNGINATTYSLELLTSSIWLYFLIKAIKMKSEYYGLLSSIFFVVNAFSSLAGAPMIIAQLYGLSEITNWKKKTWWIKNIAILSVVAILIYYFSFVNKAYPTTFNFLKILFMGSLFIWESVNGFSLAFFLVFTVSIAYIVAKFLKKKTNYFENIFILAFLSLLSSLIVFHFIPIINFVPIFAFLPIVVVKSFADKKYFKFLILAILILAIVKIAPIVYMFHLDVHPHKAYALWLNQVAQGDIVLAGHECPWLQYYTNLTIVCRARDLQAINIQNKNVIVTEEYFKNENEMEFEYLVNSFNLPFSGVVEQELGKPDVIANNTISKLMDYPYPTRPIEDPYQWLYTIYPRFYVSIFFNYEFLKPQYAIYSVK